MNIIIKVLLLESDKIVFIIQIQKEKPDKILSDGAVS